MPSTDTPAILAALADNGYSMRRTAKALSITPDEARSRFADATGDATGLVWIFRNAGQRR